MFDTVARESAPPVPTGVPILQFVSFEVLPLAGGELRVSSSGAYLDEESLEFLADEVETFCVPTIDEVLSVIRRSLTDALCAHDVKEKH
jgi:hypothetical protein